MITFRDVVRHERAEDKLAYLGACLAVEDAEGAFVEAGELEQGVVDALHPERDGWGEVERLLRRLSWWTGAAYHARRSGAAPRDALRRATEVLERLARGGLPESLQVRAPEGYIHYALDPMGYARAAERYAEEVGRERAGRAVVVGVRSVGTSLAGMVAAALGAHRSITVRPRGATGQRRVHAGGEVRERVRRWLEHGGDALVVDEGPGATGETFQCVARWLRELGVEPGRLALFPSHLQPPGLAGPEVRSFYEGSRRYAPPVRDDRVERVCERFGLREPEDLSAGRWRRVVPGAGGAAAVPRHERLKYRALDRDGRPFLVRFAGLGRTGAEVAVRAHCLESAGLGPEVVGREEGFVVSAWVEGRALSPGRVRSPGFALALATYLSARASLFRTGEAADPEPILAMLRENATGALGERPDGLAAALRRLERLPRREAVVPDARLHAREWIRTRDRYVKLDATEHGDGVRLPGPADAAWDVAAAAVEFRLGDGALGELVRLCGRGAHGGAAGLGEAVAAYRAPYAACQLGEAVLAARETADEDDRERLGAEAERYRALLRRELARAGAGAPPPRSLHPAAP